MLLIVGRVVAVLFACIAALQFVTAFVTEQWQCWVAGGGLLVTAWGWWCLGGVWREATLTQPRQAGSVLLGKGAARWALVALAGIVVAVIAMSPLG